MAEYGLLTEVSVEPRTTELAADAAISATELEVVDAGDLDGEDGGTILLNGALLDYTSVIWGETEDDTDLIELAAPLAVAADAGDPVQSVAGSAGEEDWYAMVDMGGGGAAVAVPIRFDQRMSFAPGIYDPPIPAVVSEDLSRIEDLPGSTPAGSVAFCNTDQVTLTEPGDATLDLTHTPIDGSLIVFWNTRKVPVANWTLDGTTLTVLDPDVVFDAGHIISTDYAYNAGASALVQTLDPPTGGTILAFEATGWKWKQIARTDATDYSASAYDDSAWSTAPASFGDGGDMADGTGGTHVTLWQKTTRMWARRTLAGMTIGQDVTATIRADDMLTIWLGGTQVYDGHPNGTELTVSIPGSFITATSMKLACRVTDEASSLGCFFDLELVQ